MARELIGADGQVTAVSYIDKATRTEKQIRCRTVVVAASACESARLLLNSRSSRFPTGSPTRRAWSVATSPTRGLQP